MINIPIDPSASILEPFYDSGDSYVGHHKYNVLNRYRIEPAGKASIKWDGLSVDIAPSSKTVMETKGLNTNVTGYNHFRLHGLIPTWVHVKVYCNDELVLDENGGGMTGYLDGDIRINHNTVRSLKFEFINERNLEANASIHYLGMLSDVPRRESPFNDEWEGFFADEPDYGIYDETLFSEAELEVLREKIKIEPYKSVYEKARQEAYDAMNDYPEKQIGRTVYKHHRCKVNIKATAELAIVGQIEKNKEMLKMACRNALSLASCDHWTADDMEIIPMIVWKHRAFTESYMMQHVCVVLWLAGGLLSWHGRNYLYNALIIKGLPRVEADLMTMDYIYECNQGISFMHGYIQALVTLSRPYPRYKKKIEDAKKLLEENYHNIIAEDGSFHEGGMYLNYTMRHFLPIAYYVSRYEKKSLQELFGEKLARVSNFGLSILSEKARWISMGDCGNGMYTMMMPAMMYLATGDTRWAAVMKHTNTLTLLEMIIAAVINVPEGEELSASEFAYFPKLGFTRVCRDGIMMAIASGPSNDTHTHCDKGSFVVYKGGELVVPDVYAPYNYAEAVGMYKTSNHSLAVPFIDGEYVDQRRGKQYESVVKKSSCDNSIFEFECDNNEIWDSPDILTSKRSIYSEKPNEFIITDEFTFAKEGQVEFRINMALGAQIDVIPVNWEVQEETVIELFNFKNSIISQKKMLSKKLTSCQLITKVVIL